MKFSLGSAILAITCICLALGWYVEHSRLTQAQSLWRNERRNFLSERSNLVVAATLLGNRSAKVDFDDLDEGGWVGPDDEKQTDEQINKQYAAECLIIMNNIEEDMLKVLAIHYQANGDMRHHFRTILHEYWDVAGKPSFEELERLAANSGSYLSIERPEALKKWMRAFY